MHRLPVPPAPATTGTFHGRGDRGRLGMAVDGISTTRVLDDTELFGSFHRLGSR